MIQPALSSISNSLDVASELLAHRLQNTICAMDYLCCYTELLLLLLQGRPDTSRNITFGRYGVGAPPQIDMYPFAHLLGSANLVITFHSVTSASP